MTGRYVPCSMTLRMFQSKFRIPDNYWQQFDYEWVYEALQIMAIPNVLKFHKTPIRISNYRGKLPCNTEVILGFEHSGFRMYMTNNMLLKSLNVNNMGMLFGNPIEPSPEKEYLLSASRNLAEPLITSLEYQIDGDDIRVGFESGTINIYHLGLMLCEDGTPLIYDRPFVHDAIHWHILKNLCYGSYDYKLSLLDVIELSERKLAFARNELRFDTNSTDYYEMFKSMWKRIAVPQVNSNVFNFKAEYPEYFTYGT